MRRCQSPRQIVSRGVLVVALATLACAGAGTPEAMAPEEPAQSAQTPAVSRQDILYILPFWSGFGGGTQEALTREAAELRRRIGPEGPYVKLGFSGYVFLKMHDPGVAVTDTQGIRARLADTVAQIDTFVNQGRLAGVPVGLSVLTPVRERYDPVQQATEAADVRCMQWLADNSVARGWWSHSRYARHARGLQEAYVREVGKVLANRMHRYPETLVAASGDGEVELAFSDGRAGADPSKYFADYSPFTVAEFRDWLRLGGLYAPGQPYEGQGYEHGSRYAGDRTPGDDTNGDGHTLNGDVGTAFTSWALLHFDWDLAETIGDQDPRAIPLARYEAPAFVRLPAARPGGFDPPRVPAADRSHAWWNLWVLFKQTMLQHHNTDFARWVTTSADPETGATVPPDRWYSYQIPADYAFNGTPENPTERFKSSMSSWWTGDTTPYGSLGITAFNLDWSVATPPSPPTYTLRHVAPHVAARGLRWGVIEWNPGLLPFDSGTTSQTQMYTDEMAVVERYRPSLLQPFAWGDKVNRVQDTGFETALRDMVARINSSKAPTLSVGVPSMRLAASQAGAVTPAQAVLVDQTGWARVAWTASSTVPWLRVTPASGHGTGQLTVSVDGSAAARLAPGAHTAVVRVSGAPRVASPAELTVTLTVIPSAATQAPFGQVDSPPQGATGLQGTIPVSGWVLDDVGVVAVDVYRLCGAWDPASACRVVDGHRVVFVGAASLQEGARPDVAAAFVAFPQAHRAAWGYLLDSATMPAVDAGVATGGRGPLQLVIVARDAEGKTTVIGRSPSDHTPTTIVLANPR